MLEGRDFFSVICFARYWRLGILISILFFALVLALSLHGLEVSHQFFTFLRLFVQGADVHVLIPPNFPHIFILLRLFIHATDANLSIGMG